MSSAAPESAAEGVADANTFAGQVEELQARIARLEEEKRHASLTHRDDVIGLRAQMTTERTELLEISAGFSNALAILEVREHKIETLQSSNSALRAKLFAERALLKQRSRELAAVRSSLTWRIGRAITKPLSAFKRPRA